ncbi:TIGR04283 family arsenosugar biosynthesis glycosyltransferase [Microseira wollei]|uniref:4,4'-diaponeurosporenoate glycosyltransferase n=1 Tax=Microseira wollei NIES-4236 TaxID=2530354 RepID=A0AAV3WGK9_9CYAN|nr:TIGR04283 family arsenosugar biosynthesis glycosyltransferase [Microseira wollei]GET37569.1 glycosyl transferase, family 2 [Microseira wollei NIES-4236]
MLKEIISIIIPVLNEASTINKTLASIKKASNIEIIVVDGGSEDETVALAQSLGIKVLFSPPGRATQMNRGAAAATGDILLFLHADTRLPNNFDTSVRQSLQIQKTIAGAFELKIDSDIPSLRIVEKMVNVRSRYLQMPYGDQAIFLKATVFNQIGGFPNLPIMEDFELVRRLQPLGKIEIVPAPVVTSGRRWQKLGVLKTTLINQLIILGYFLGIPPDQLAQWYRIKHKSH